MVASYRCNEIKEEAFSAVYDKIQALASDCQGRLITDFTERSRSIVKQAFVLYDAEAH